jgi:hypothetical protein
MSRENAFLVSGDEGSAAGVSGVEGSAGRVTAAAGILDLNTGMIPGFAEAFSSQLDGFAFYTPL